jgi:hypothetical protein
VVAVSRSGGRSEIEIEDAHRVKELVQNGVTVLDLSPREFVLLYLHYPELLSDVEVGDRDVGEGQQHE